MSKIILLTGSTSGIGKAAALELVKSASILILPIRNLAKGEALKTELQSINSKCQIDLFECNLESIESMKYTAIKIASQYPVVDVLINNAGIMEPQFRQTADGLESHFEVNLLSQFIFGTILKLNLLASSQGRIINLSSALHTQGKFEIDMINKELKSKILDGIGLYSNSNLYRNMLTFWQAEELKNTNITVNCMHPGVIKTNLGADGNTLIWNIMKPIFRLFTKPAIEGAKTIIHLALSDEAGKITGQYWTNCKGVESSELSRDLDLTAKLIQKCQEVAKI